MKESFSQNKRKLKVPEVEQSYIKESWKCPDRLCPKCPDRLWHPPESEVPEVEQSYQRKLEVPGQIMTPPESEVPEVEQSYKRNPNVLVIRGSSISLVYKSQCVSWKQNARTYERTSSTLRTKMQTSLLGENEYNFLTIFTWF